MGIAYRRDKNVGALNYLSGGFGVESVQNISQLINHAATGSYTDDTTITSVDTSKTLVFVRTEAAGTAALSFSGSARLLNSTTVRWASYVAGTGSLNNTFYADVVTFRNKPQSIQYVVGGSSPVTISSVDTSKSFIMSMNFAGYYDTYNTATLASATSVTVPTGTGSSDMYWVVVEGI